MLKNGCLIADGTPEEVLTKERIHEIYEIDCDVSLNARTGFLSIVYHPSLPLPAMRCKDAG